jgi:hypothetical protein
MVQKGRVYIAYDEGNVTPYPEIRREGEEEGNGRDGENKWRGQTYTWPLKSFIISKKWLYTSGLSWNWTLTASR